MIRNIIIVNDFSYIQGGADTVAITTSIALAQKGIHVVFFSAVPPVEKKLMAANIDVICLNKKDILHDKNRINAAVNGIYDKNVEKSFHEVLQHYSNKDTLVHIHTWTKSLSSAVFSVAAALRFKTVLTLHDYFTICPNGGLFNYQKNEICRHIPMSLKCILSNCDRRSYAQKQWRVVRQLIQNKQFSQIENLYLIAVSHKVASEVSERIPNKKAQTFYLANPVEIMRGKQIDIKPDAAYLFMGRIEEEKCPELFCEAITKLGLKGIVVGDGNMKNELQKQYPNILFTGWLTGQAKLDAIKSCKCLIFTSKCYETYGLVVAEMKALGIPSIIPKGSAAEEQIKDGYNGFTYLNGNLNSLLGAISSFEKIDLKKIQENVIKSFDAEQNSLDSHIDRLLEIYKSISLQNVNIFNTDT